MKKELEWLKCLKLRTDISLGEDGYKYLDNIIEFCSSKPLSGKKPDPLTFHFKCGCFLTVYLDLNNKLNAGLACCEVHEHPYAKTEDFKLSNFETCLNCRGTGICWTDEVTPIKFDCTECDGTGRIYDNSVV